MAERLRPHSPPIMLLAQLNDACVAAGLFWVLSFYFSDHRSLHLGMAALVFVLTLVCFRSMGLYESWRLASPHAEIQKILGGCLLIYVVLLSLGYLLQIFDRFPRRALLSWMAVLPMFLSMQRVAIRAFLRNRRVKGYNARTAVVVGAGEQSRRLVRLVEENLWAGTKILGYFNGEGADDSMGGYACLGPVKSLPAYIRDNQVDVVYLALSMREQDKLKDILMELTDTTASVCFVPDVFFVDLLLGASITYFDNLPILTMRETPLVGINALLKRAEDIILSILILLAISPVMLLIAAAIKLTSPGPVIFKQWRYGLNCRGIQIYKFRTMTVCEDGYDFTQATEGDPRVTRLGAFLRRTSLDELPQFFNVLQGRMSIVGPRPHPVAMNEQFRKVVPGYILRHKVKPGITGLAQVHGWRGQTDTLEKIEKRVQFDLEYLRTWSLLLDLRIIIQTVFMGAWRSNAY